jgi:hypothetical protein
MKGALTTPMLALIFFCILAEMGREVCFKHAANTPRPLSIAHQAGDVGRYCLLGDGTDRLDGRAGTRAFPSHFL